ncbi:hypothetical protein [Comamonas composti]|uniref:hypothetical protein n=1 Tax=Comamonas composti TaxID=408558 RepID=UPI0012EBA511|nr:hypothetical protein [Comamonas composti]
MSKKGHFLYEDGLFSCLFLVRPHAEFATLTKRELHELADGLLVPEPLIIERAVQFMLADTQGLWHGRARAMISRRLKHCSLGRTHRTQLFECITGRLSSGQFSEQFKDQLRLAMHLDLARTLEVCKKAIGSKKLHVQRYAPWALSPEHEQNAP